MHAVDIEQLLHEQLVGSDIRVDGDGHHFNIIVISDAFTDKSRVARQQMVYQVLGEAIQRGDIHAVSMRTHTPGEWQALQQGEGE
ncbi:MAG: BolA family transcriptional regulator [Legionellales bacterium]|nr:BolA family transcriptional regulator [Legionellales bacterium]|tara:strand:- start:3274 stop:3528 length:255 start_codon:yes stop_codon:yes gene_type:complete